MSYAALRDKKQELIRKARDGSAFIAPITGPVITTLTTGASSDLTPLPTPTDPKDAYVDLGYASTDGVTWGRSTNISNVSSFGSVEPTRSDVTQDTITMQVVAQETKLLTMGLYTGADVAALTADATTGEVSIAKPDRPGFKYYRVFAVFVDTDDTGAEIYMARYMPRARVTDMAEQKFTDGDQAVEYNMTFTGYTDSALGFSHKWFWGGPGWKNLLTKMAIPLAGA